jgi:CUB domain
MNVTFQVYDGPSDNAPSLANYTGYSTPPGVSSTGNFMLLYFTTNAINQFAGFSARYSTVTELLIIWFIVIR